MTSAYKWMVHVWLNLMDFVVQVWSTTHIHFRWHQKSILYHYYLYLWQSLKTADQLKEYEAKFKEVEDLLKTFMGKYIFYISCIKEFYTSLSRNDACVIQLYWRCASCKLLSVFVGTIIVYSIVRKFNNVVKKAWVDPDLSIVTWRISELQFGRQTKY